MRASGAPKTAISHLTVHPIDFRPVRFVDCGEAGAFKAGPGKIYLHHPAWIIEGIYLDPIVMLPIAITLRLIPVLYPNENLVIGVGLFFAHAHILSDQQLYQHPDRGKPPRNIVVLGTLTIAEIMSHRAGLDANPRTPC